jgi:hypothetical protein
MFLCNPQESRKGAMPFREGRFGLDSGIIKFALYFFQSANGCQKPIIQRLSRSCLFI